MSDSVERKTAALLGECIRAGMPYLGEFVALSRKVPQLGELSNGAWDLSEPAGVDLQAGQLSEPTQAVRKRERGCALLAAAADVESLQGGHVADGERQLWQWVLREHQLSHAPEVAHAARELRKRAVDGVSITTQSERGTNRGRIVAAWNEPAASP